MESPHPVLLSSGSSHVLPLEVVRHADIQIPRILFVWAAFQHTLDDLPLVDDQSVF